MLQRNTYNPYMCDIMITRNQQKYLVNQVINQIDLYYKGLDDRRMILNAFTGSGKTTISLQVLIPEFIEKFYSQGKRVIAFIAPRGEVVEQSYLKAKKYLLNKTINGAVVKCYNSDEISVFKKKTQGEKNINLDGDVVILFLTAQYFNTNFNLLSKDNAIDLVIVDEAHIMFGTISAEDTKADKGAWNWNFKAVTSDKLRTITPAVLFLTATPTNSQQQLTALGKENNIYLDPMPRDVLTTAFFDLIPYVDSEDTVTSGLQHFKAECDKVALAIKCITDATWKAGDKFRPEYPVALIRLGRRGAKNGVDYEQNIDDIVKLCRQYDFHILVSNSEERWLNHEYNTVLSLAEGIRLLDQKNDKPGVIIVIESGSAGLDLPKINNVIIGRDPKGTIHNNYSQTCGRAARMKQGFINHADAADAIKNYPVTDDQKRYLAEYYILLSTASIHVPVDNKLLNTDVKDFIESDSYREVEGRKFILENIFGKNHDILRNGLYLSTSTSIQNDEYKQFKKDYCECCNIDKDSQTHCYYAAWAGFQKLIGVKISEPEMKLLWPLCLHVHHLDGNHFNNDPKNLVTICPNVHSLITIYNEDYNNRYTELREMLTKIANKKGGNPPATVAF